jgi:hypothetical protein
MLADLVNVNVNVAVVKSTNGVVVPDATVV